MPSLMEKWLENCTGLKIALSPATLGETCFDGTLYAKILSSYGICGINFIKNMIKTDKYCTAYNNLKKLCIWFKLLEIPCSEYLLEDIANKKGQSALKLLYELFLRLEGRDNIRMLKMKDEKTSQPAENVEVRESMRGSKEMLERISKEKYLGTIKFSLENSLKECDRQRMNAEKLIRKMNTAIPKMIREDSPPKDVFREITDFERNLGRQEVVLNIEKCKPNAFVSFTKIKQRLKEDENYSRYLDNKNILEQAWRNALRINEEMNREELAKNFYLVSEKEKEEASILKEIRRRENKEVIESKTSLVEVFPKDILTGKGEQRDMNKTKRDRMKTLHDRLYRIKMDAKRELLPPACERIAQDIADLSFLQGEFKVTTLMEKLLKYMFLKGVPVIQSPVPCERTQPSSNLVSECDESELDSEYEQYVALEGPWQPEKVLGIPNKAESLNVVGHIVHRIISNETEVQKPQDQLVQFPSFEIRILLRPHLHPELAGELTTKLQPDIIVLNANLVVEYALSAYKLFYFESEGKDKTPEARNWTTDVIRKDGSRSVQITKLKMPLRSSVRDTTSQPVLPKFREAAVQVPDEIEWDLKYQCPSTPGIILLAELVFNFMKEKIEIPYILKCFIIIDIIKNLDGFKGWMIINFIPNPIGIALLEYVYSGFEPSFLKESMDLEAEWAELKNRLNPIQETLSTLESCYSKIVPENMAKSGPEEVDSENSESKEDKSATKELSNIEKALEAIRTLCDLMVLSYDEELTKIQSRKADSSEKLIKKSNILPKPYADTPIKSFESIFTHVLRISDRFCQMTYGCSGNEEEEEAIEEEAVEEEEEKAITGEEEGQILEKEENTINIARLSVSTGSIEMDIVDAFYEENRIFIKFPFSKYNDDTIKILVLTISNSNELKKNDSFTDFLTSLAVKYFENALTRSEGELNLLQNKTSSRSLGQCSEKMVDLHETFPEENSTEEMSSEVAEEESVTLYPGHPLWPYTTPCIPKEYLKPLSIIWDTVENGYTNDLFQTFLFLKEVDSETVQFSNYVLSKCEECVCLTDEREEIAQCFQNVLNGAIPTSGTGKAGKEELYRSAFKLQCILWHLADIKKQYSQRVINEVKDEPVKLLCKYCRCFMSLLQAEVDRFIYSMQVITDYHCMFITDSPSKERIQNIYLPEFKCYTDAKEPHIPNDIEPDNPKVLKAQEDFLNKNAKYLKLDTKTKLYITDGSNSLRFIVRVKEILKAKIKDVKTLCKKIYKDVCPIVLFKQNRSSNEELARMMLEWKAALKEETNRISFRIKLILARALQIVKDRTSDLEGAMEGFLKDVSRQYRIEIYNIDKFCLELNAAISGEVEVEVGKYEFYGNHYLKYSCQTPPTTPANILKAGYKFTLKQLRNLVRKFCEVAPTGVLKRSLIYILEDMSMTGHDSGHAYLPPVWSYLRPKSISYLVDQCFGKKSVVSWKDFVIYALDLRYPTLREIWNLKKEYQKFDDAGLELINYKNFKQTSLWFQKSNRETRLRNCELKVLLFDLFETDGHINYKCFLLAFCKDENPNVAFLKALTVIDDRVFRMLANKSIYADTFSKFETFADVMDIIWNDIVRVLLPEIIEEEFDEEFICEEGSQLPYFEMSSSELDILESSTHVSMSHESLTGSISFESDLLNRIQESVPRKLLPQMAVCERSARVKLARLKLARKKSSRKKSLTLKKLLFTFHWFMSNSHGKETSTEDNQDTKQEVFLGPEYLEKESLKARKSKRDRINSKKRHWASQSKLLKIAKVYALHSLRQGIRKHKVHVDKLLGLLLFCLHYFAFHPKHACKGLVIAGKFKKIFSDKGNGFTLCFHKLLEDCFMKELLSSHAFFRRISLTEYSFMLFEAKMNISKINPQP